MGLAALRPRLSGSLLGGERRYLFVCSTTRAYRHTVTVRFERLGDNFANMCQVIGRYFMLLVEDSESFGPRAGQGLQARTHRTFGIQASYEMRVIVTSFPSRAVSFSSGLTLYLFSSSSVTSFIDELQIKSGYAWPSSARLWPVKSSPVTTSVPLTYFVILRDSKGTSYGFCGAIRLLVRVFDRLGVGCLVTWNLGEPALFHVCRCVLTYATVWLRI
jgi:hypothetical protein